MSTAVRKSLLERARDVLSTYRPTQIVAKGEMIAAAVAVMLHDGEEGLEALFIHRAVRAGDTWSGQIAFPGGRREPRDADLLDTAIRETHEEIGVDLTAAERLGVLDDLYPRTPLLPPVVVRPFVFALTARPAFALSAEVQAAFGCPSARSRSQACEGRSRSIILASPVECFPHIHWVNTLSGG